MMQKVIELKGFLESKEKYIDILKSKREEFDKENKDFDRQREREERGKEVPEPVLPEVKDLR